MTTPTDILDQMKRPAKWNGWVPTVSGKGYRPWNKDPGEVDVSDIGHGLAHTFRYGGQTRPAITVAEHSILASHIAETLWPDADPKVIQATLLHDASEAFLHDIQGPLRSEVFVRRESGGFITWSQSDLLVTTNICRQFGINGGHLVTPIVRAADMLCVSIEKRDCPTLGNEDWGLPAIPEAITHIQLNWLNPRQAKVAFMSRMEKLGLLTP